MFSAFSAYVSYLLRSVRLRILPFVLLLMGGCAAGNGFAMNDEITIRISIVDESGEPVQFATVGRTIAPSPDSSKVSTDLSESDLKRLLERNPSAWEYWNSYHGPVRRLMLAGISNEAGKITVETHYSGGEASRKFSRPERFPISFAVYRQGYHPAYKTISITKNDKLLDVEIKLQRNEHEDARISGFMRTLHEARLEISNRRANEEISMANHNRLEKMREKLHETARMAAAEGRNQEAAMSEYWAGMVPRIPLHNGRPNGYIQFDHKSPMTLAAFGKAAEYDPENHHVVSQWLVIRNRVIAKKAHRDEITHEQWIEERRNILHRSLELDQVAGGMLWPNFHEMVANTHGFLKDCVNDLKKLEWLQEFEPKYRDYSDSINAIKRNFDNEYFCK